MKYTVYKGLQRPLVLIGLKGRYIIWGVGTFCFSFITLVILIIIFDILIALIGLMCVLIIGFGYIYIKMKKGLFDKKKMNDIYIVNHLIKR